ncbi:unnamed protein product [Didymodactylos carnosus]|uniref:Uncharacterized protein n=1 Tax=Didymodactylos carnosus TaxID=1234261 RepID=A0A815L218_9BILA|nr:unnamed protein product [Didymodactylos carnosus]CAF1401055.1 unnamed protein product [Didymodactylos carnosus]CAF3652755.1 unnamed protein product [Didymodactylos carnosus]CAF4294901.1 unnamed protein product [Didymodactylos carnosus]
MIKILQTTLKTNDLTPPPAGSLNNLSSGGHSPNDTMNLRPSTYQCQSTVSFSQPATQKRIIKLTVFGDSTITHLNASHIHVPGRSTVQFRSGCSNFDHLSSQVLHDKLKTDITSYSLVVVGTNNLSSRDTVDTTIDKLKLFVSIFKEKYSDKKLIIATVPLRRHIGLKKDVDSLHDDIEKYNTDYDHCQKAKIFH